MFAELTDCRAQWKQALEGWNVDVSLQVLEWQAEAAKRATRETKTEDLLRVLRKRFPPAIPGDMERAIRGASDIEQLDRWLDEAACASSLAAFKRSAGLANGGGRRSKTGRSARRHRN